MYIMKEKRYEEEIRQKNTTDIDTYAGGDDAGRLRW